MKKLVKHFVTLILTVMFSSMIYAADITYIEVDSIQNATMIKLKSLSDFETLIEKNNVKTVYLYTSTNDGLINIEGTFFSFQLKGYLSIEDYKTGEAKGFKNGKDFNTAKKLGFNSVELYNFFIRNNFASSEDCKDAFKNGFATREKTATNYNCTESNNYYSAKKLNYSTYSEYNEYLHWSGLRYKSKADWQNAMKNGFPNSTDYYAATGKGFSTFQDYKTAKDFGLNTYDELQKFTEIIESIEKIASEKSLDKKNSIIFYFIQNLPKTESSLKILSSTLRKKYESFEPGVKTALSRYASSQLSQSETAGIEDQIHSVLAELGLDDPMLYDRGRQPEQTNISSFFTEESLKTFFKNVDTGKLCTYDRTSDIFKKTF